MSEKKSINENELDELLRDLYLEENSNAINEKEAGFIFSQNYAIKPDQKKEKELIAKLQNKAGGISGKFIFMLLIVIGFSALVIFYCYSKNTITQTGSGNITQNTSANANENENPGAQHENGTLRETTSELKIADTFGRPSVMNPLITKDTTAIIKMKDQFAYKQEKNERTVPFLTETDKVKYRNIKIQIINALLKSDKGLYTKIPAYKTDYAGKSIVLDAFTIRNVGISNLEYKTFLADLLAQNRHEDYLKCRVLDENWISYGYSMLANSYFTDEKFNDFPVVNISYDAANLFCKWFEEEIRMHIQQNHLKSKNLHIRLPFAEEWIFAAREGYAKIAFENGYNTLYDETSGLVNKSFTNRVELVKKRVKRIDTLYTTFTTNRYGWSEKQTLEFFATGSNYYKAMPADTIYSERMKVMGKIGHVSEMVPQRNTGIIWLSGLSWKNKDEYQKMENEFKTSTSSPFVGFRIIVVNPNDPDYKKPFW